MRISVFGLGYVGAVTGACIADSGHEVIAVDTDPLKVNCIRDGRSPIVEPGLGELIAKTVANGSLRATVDCEEAIMNSDMSLICVDTPRGYKVCAKYGLLVRKYTYCIMSTTEHGVNYVLYGL